VSGIVQGRSGQSYTIGADGTISNVSYQDYTALLAGGFRAFVTSGRAARFSAPIAAELVSIKAAATPANGAATIAGQPDFPRKLQIRIVIGTTTTTAITGGSLVIVGIDASGNVVTETISLIANASTTLKSTYAYSHVTSLTVSGYAANGSGTGNTLGLGVAADLGVTVPLGAVDFAVYKTNVNNADEAVAATADTAAFTIAPTSAANASRNYDIYYSYGAPGSA
jgi:hypothetical protein